MDKTKSLITPAIAEGLTHLVGDDLSLLYPHVVEQIKVPEDWCQRMNWPPFLVDLIERGRINSVDSATLAQTLAWIVKCSQQVYAYARHFDTGYTQDWIKLPKSMTKIHKQLMQMYPIEGTGTFPDWDFTYHFIGPISMLKLRRIDDHIFIIEATE